MDHKSALLNDLRIDRGVDARQRAPRPGWVVHAVALVLVSVAAAGWWAFTRPEAVPVRTALAVASVVPGNAAASAGGPSALDASGYVVARRQATVSAKITGRVTEVLIEEGQRVAEGEVIARLDASTALAALEQARAQRAHAEAELQGARIAIEDARPIYEREQRQFASGIVSANSFDNAKAAFNALEADLAVKERAVEVARANVAIAERNYEDTIVRAPFSGVVTVKAAQTGEIVSPISAGGGFTRTGIGTIVDMDSLEVEVDVSESFINRVRPGQQASVRLNAYPDWTIPAEVIAVVPTADRAKATVKVRVGFREKDERVLPEMGARVSFFDPAEQIEAADGAEGAAPASVAAVMVPAESVMGNGRTGIVYVVRDGKLERRTVRLGARANGQQIVSSGLAAGTQVVVGGIEQLADGMRVSIAE